MQLFGKKILVFSRLNIKNFGDPIIADCCRYIIKKVAKENKIRARVTIADVYEKDPAVMAKVLRKKDAVVFPGGGMNSVVFNNIVLDIMKEIKKNPSTSIFFNAIGILRVKPKKKNEDLLKEIYNHDQVKQVTTRGDLEQLKQYIHTEKKYPTKLVFDPAIWVNEAYGISKKEDAEVIGIGVIRPEIYKSNGNEFSEEDVLNMYKGIIHELEARGHKWKLFTNGMKDDYKFGVKLLQEMNLDKKKYLGKNVKDCHELVRTIAGFKAVIAARLHANIISTSLQVPSVGLVWNDKMNLFAQIIGCEERYVKPDSLLDSKLIVDQVEAAIENGYDQEKIDAMKAITVETIKNILKC